MAANICSNASIPLASTGINFNWTPDLGPIAGILCSVPSVNPENITTYHGAISYDNSIPVYGNSAYLSSLNWTIRADIDLYGNTISDCTGNTIAGPLRFSQRGAGGALNINYSIADFLTACKRSSLKGSSFIDPLVSIRNLEGLVIVDDIGSVTAEFVLTYRPNDTVTISLTSSNSAISYATLSTCALTFTPLNWVLNISCHIYLTVFL